MKKNSQKQNSSERTHFKIISHNKITKRRLSACFRDIKEFLTRMSFAKNMEKKIESLGGKKIKVKYIPGGNSMQMSPSKEICEDTRKKGGGFIKLEESVIAALNVADDIVLEEGEMTKSDLKKLKKKMKMRRRDRRMMKVKEEKIGKVKEERSKYSGLWKREEGGAKVFNFLSFLCCC